jgi:uroporphyrinogen III methyltransferase/synthase
MARIDFVGAPSDPDLFTLAAVDRLARAERVFVDAELREAVSPHVGGATRIETADGNHVRGMIEAAASGARVVRAMRGDPLFLAEARGEVEAAWGAGVEVAIVPGVPEVVAAAARAGLALSAPITIARGDEQDRTLVLVGDAERLLAAGARLLVAGTPPSTPVAAIPWPPARGSRPVVARLDALRAEELTAAGPRSMLAIGRGLSDTPPFGWLSRRALHGKVVAITRAATQAGETARAVRARGGIPLETPTIAIEPPADPGPLASAARAIGTYDVVAFTSSNGVDATFAAIRDAGLDARALGRALVAVIGPGTARALEPHGVRPDLVAEEHRGEGLATAIAQKIGALAGKRVLLSRAEVARDALPDALRAGGAHVDVVTAYRSVAASREALSPLREALLAGEVDVVTFTASSTATRFCEAFPDAQALLAKTIVASIGPITSDALRARGLRVDVEANPFTIPALLDAIEQHFGA